MIDPPAIDEFEEAVRALVDYVESPGGASSPSSVSEVAKLSNRIRWSQIGNLNVTENIGRIKDEVEILSSPRKWASRGVDWHRYMLERGISGLQIAADRAVRDARRVNDPQDEIAP